MNLAEVNGLELAQFAARFGGVFEHSPWVAERAWQRRPFANVEGLFQAMAAEVHSAALSEQLALIRAHQELAGREAEAGALTADSTGEQGRLGLLELEQDEFMRIAALNRHYRERFGFPCIVALALHDARASVLAEMEQRVANDAGAEMIKALQQIGHIARARLRRMLEHGKTDDPRP